MGRKSNQSRLADLYACRELIKNKLTCFEKYVIDIETLFNTNKYLDEMQKAALQFRHDKINDSYNQFDQTQDEIELLAPDRDVEFATRDEIATQFCIFLSKAKVLLKNSDITTSTNISSDNLLCSQTAQLQMSHPRSIKLPVIDLPKFNGNYNNWLEYRDTFLSTIHNNNTIDDVIKFRYLKSSLQGEAAELVNYLEISSQNYQLAWKVLCERFNKTRLLVNNHIKSLFNLTKLEKESAKGLRQLVSETTQHLRALEVLEQVTNQCDSFVIYLVTSKLDLLTAREWETSIKDNDMPTIKQLISFLTSKADSLENIESNSNVTRNKSSYYDNKSIENQNRKSPKVFIATNTQICNFCNGSHLINACEKFIKLPISQRIEQVKVKKLCINCLRSGHFIRDCKSSFCRKCNSKHHTLLHREKKLVNAVENLKSLPQENIPNVVVGQSLVTTATQILLTTAIVQVVDVDGKSHDCRALLDSGSQSNLITKNLCDKLNLPTTSTKIMISGIGSVKSQINLRSKLTIKSRVQSFNKTITCFVIPNICDELPSYQFDVSELNLPRNIVLADPGFNIPEKIDMVLGADIFWQLLCSDQIKLNNSGLLLQNTKLGWVITGALPQPTNTFYCNFSKFERTNTVDIQDQLSKFWSIEECSLEPILSKEEIACENHFAQNHKFENNRLVVAIPLKDSTTKLGESKYRALCSFRALESKLNSKPELKTLYHDFIDEYIRLGHMTKVEQTVESENTPTYYMPHHGVLKADSITTKLRVVFNASAPTDTGVSFNDLQMVGPTIQSELFAILVRFREYAYVACADIAKMYRQIVVAEPQRCLQKIVWRFDTQNPIDEYTLNTVTYGTASAPFLAIRCLKQLALNHSDTNREASRIITEEFYVDDLLTGDNNMDKLVENCKQITSILKSGSFELRKWKSNDQRVLNSLNQEKDENMLNFGQNENMKTLGIFWSCELDTLTYKINTEYETQVTKRTLLSNISQIFDPLGLLGICTITIKIMLQKLWLEKLSWDEPVSKSLQDRWITFKNELAELNNLQVPRHVSLENATSIEIHTFCDASQDAYGACVYIRAVDYQKKQITSNLLCAKAKVAPLKPLSIPRLELCAALVAARLTQKVIKSTRIKIDNCVFWSDSTITLAWIQTPPNLLKSFVCNRVSEIQTLTENYKWKYVPSKDNPADHISRGLSPGLVKGCSSWWHGPEWLVLEPQHWPNDNIQSKSDIPECRKQSHTFLNVDRVENSVINNFSKLCRLKGVIGYCLRFKNNCIAKAQKSHGQYGPLTVKELDLALIYIIRIVQRESFPIEYKSLSENETISRKSKLLSLNPFIDKNGLIRVGGRIHESKFDYNKRHPIIVPANHHFTTLLFRSEHIRLLHAGPQQLLYSIRENFWPISGRNVAKKIVRMCTTCFRIKPRSMNPIMGNLPAERVQQSYPFSYCGVDYGGPYLLKDRKGRNSKTSKAYICLFVCFITKAVHIELVTNLTKDAFIATFRRFVARRGKPFQINSDNGTNFVGANNELLELGKFISENSENLESHFSSEGVKWNFIPAHSPHMGGLWEAGIKSAKYHIKRVAGNASLTFEELLTLLNQIEAVLNSRPLSPLSVDPSDPLPLTPSHFLVGRPLTSVADPDLSHIPENRLSTYQKLQQLNQHFWERWAKEYISELQQRNRWKINCKNLKLSTVVLVKDNNLPPLCWMLGSIQELHPGKDGVARVATVKTTNGLFRRAIVNLCPLPHNEDSVSENINGQSSE